MVDTQRPTETTECASPAYLDLRQEQYDDAAAVPTAAEIHAFLMSDPAGQKVFHRVIEWAVVHAGDIAPHLAEGAWARAEALDEAHAAAVARLRAEFPPARSISQQLTALDELPMFVAGLTKAPDVL